MTTTTRESRLSDRARQLRPSSTLAVTAQVNALIAEGRDIIGFGAGQPDFDTPANIKDAAINALRNGQTKYAPTPGPAAAREVIARKLRDENGIACDASHIVISNGAKQCLYMVLQALLNPGDEVVAPTPCWVSYRPMVELAGGVFVEVPTTVESSFRVMPDALARAINERTRVVMLNSPSNPCGTMYTEEGLRELASVLAAYPDVTILTDEIYEKLVYGASHHFSIGSCEEIADRTVTINGLSKAYAMTGWRVGYLCAPGEEGAVAKAAARLQDQLSSSITAFCYASIEEALDRSSETVESMRRSFAQRAGLMRDLMARIDGFRAPEPAGAFYMFPEIGAHFGKRSPGGVVIDSAVSFATALLKEAGVAVVPGDDFGAGCERHIRLSFACSEDDIRQGMKRLGEFVASLR